MKVWLDSGVPQSHRVGALVAPFLGGVTCWNKSSWRRLQLGLTEPFHRDFRTPGLGCLRPNYREEAQPHPSADNWISDLLSMGLPTRVRPSFLHSQSPHKETLQASSPHPSEGKQNVNHNHIKLTKMFTWTTACLTQWNYEPCHVGPPKMDRSWLKALTKHGPLEKRMANHLSILSLRTPWTIWKGKKIWHWEMNPTPPPNSGGISVNIQLIPSSLVALVVKNLPANARDTRNVNSTLDSRRFPGKGMATHSSILAWKIPWTQEPGRLQSMWSQRVGHDFAHMPELIHVAIRQKLTQHCNATILQ